MKKNKDIKKLKNESSKLKLILAYVFFSVILILAVAILTLTDWAINKLDVSLDEIMFTLGTPLRGNGADVIKDGLRYCLPKIFLVLVIYSLLVYLDCSNKEKIVKLREKIQTKVKFDLQKTLRNIVALGSVIFLVYSVANFYIQYGVIDYLSLKELETELYDNYYVNPESVEIKAKDGATKNLICIYLESMETSFASKEVGGCQEINLIPNLTQLAQENIYFSNTENFGGYLGVSKTTWTIGALFASTSGVVIDSEFEKNVTQKDGKFAEGIVTMGDVLEDKGYVQEFLCGSDGAYAARASYFEDHGNYKIFDLFTAREEGYIPKDYYEWWGYEDKYLYEIAKDEIAELAKGDKPFNFTMLTVDTHCPDGYECELCENKFDTNMKNVIACADSQVYEFVKWCETQDFYENTVIVIMGDHETRDAVLTKNSEDVERTVYNCIINSDVDVDYDITRNRQFSSMDMFPTMLAAMGFEIEGDRLGLGTNLFSGKETLIEEIGRIDLEAELLKKSKYYIENFY